MGFEEGKAVEVGIAGENGPDSVLAFQGGNVDIMDQVALEGGNLMESLGGNGRVVITFDEDAGGWGNPKGLDESP